MNTTITSRRIIAGAGALAIAGGLAAAGAGLACAGTVPVTHPGEPTIAMTITNHTDRTEWLESATPGSGGWVSAPHAALAPGASETVVSTAPHAPYETDFVTYRLGAVGPSATYEVQNVRGEVNTGMTGTTAGHYFIDAHIDSGFPNVNASFDQW